MKRTEREPIQWEDTLDLKEKEYIEKVTAQNTTIAVVKKALKANTLKHLLGAVVLPNLPREFNEVKEEMHKRVSQLLREEADLKQLSLRGSYVREGLSATLEQSGHYEVLDIDFKDKRIIMKEDTWVQAFKHWRDEDTVKQEMDWITHRLNTLKPKRSESEELAQKKRDALLEELDLQKGWQAHWVENNNTPFLSGVMGEVDRLIALLEAHGFALEKNGFSNRTHYSFKTPFRWEEDHWNELTKWQRRFARQTNQPEGEMCHTHYTGLVTYQLHSLLTIAEINNDYTMAWYERRFTDAEWHDLAKALSYGGFKIGRVQEMIQAKDEASGNVVVFYPNGHFIVEVQEDADASTLPARLGIYPFISSPAFKYWMSMLTKNTVSTSRD